MAATYIYGSFASSLRLQISPMTPHVPKGGNAISSRIADETARGTLMFRFSKPETPRAALFVFLRNETRAKSGFVSYVSISLCFDFGPSKDRVFLDSYSRLQFNDQKWPCSCSCSVECCSAAVQQCTAHGSASSSVPSTLQCPWCARLLTLHFILLCSEVGTKNEKKDDNDNDNDDKRTTNHELNCI